LSKQFKKNEIKGIKRDNKRQREARKKLITRISVIAVIVAFLGYLIVSNLMKEEREVYTFSKEGELSLTDASGNVKADIDIEIADTDYDRMLGLMYRKEMGMNQGMLFIFPAAEMQSFWMRNTFLSLDMYFISEDYTINTIHKNTKTLSDQSYPSEKPSKYVLEVLAGFTDKYNIKPGDKIKIK